MKYHSEKTVLKVSLYFRHSFSFHCTRYRVFLQFRGNDFRTEVRYHRCPESRVAISRKEIWLMILYYHICVTKGRSIAYKTFAVQKISSNVLFTAVRLMRSYINAKFSLLCKQFLRILPNQFINVFFCESSLQHLKSVC